MQTIDSLFCYCERSHEPQRVNTHGTPTYRSKGKTGSLQQQLTLAAGYRVFFFCFLIGLKSG